MSEREKKEELGRKYQEKRERELLKREEGEGRREKEREKGREKERQREREKEQVLKRMMYERGGGDFDQSAALKDRCEKEMKSMQSL